MSVLQPDLIVTTADQESEDRVRQLPLLAVEVLSPSTRRYDLTTKRDLYEEAGVPALWIIDPPQATITVLHLIEHGFSEVAVAGAGETLESDRPFPLTLEVDQVLRAGA